MFVGGAFNQPFSFQRVEPIQSGFVGRDLAPQLDFTDEGGHPVFIEIPKDIIEDCLLFVGQGESSHAGLRGVKSYNKIDQQDIGNINIL